MLLADTMAIFFVIVGLLIAFPALWLLCRGLWPKMMEECRADCKSGLVKPFLCGLPTFLFVLLFGVVIGGKKFGAVGDISSLALLSIFFVYANAGISALATHVGDRLQSPADRERPWLATIRGGVVLELSFLLPFVGWLMIWPVAMCIGCGSVTRSFWKRRKKGASITPLSQPAETPQGAASESQSA